MSLTPVVLVNSSNHQLLVNLSVPITQVNVTASTFNVSKPVCYSNASNHVICNSTVFNFVSDCQSVEHFRKLIDANRKRPR